MHQQHRRAVVRLALHHVAAVGLKPGLSKRDPVGGERETDPVVEATLVEELVALRWGYAFAVVIPSPSGKGHRRSNPNNRRVSRFALPWLRWRQHRLTFHEWRVPGAGHIGRGCDQEVVHEELSRPADVDDGGSAAGAADRAVCIGSQVRRHSVVSGEVVRGRPDGRQHAPKPNIDIHP